MSEEAANDEVGETPPTPKKRKRAMMTVYNASMIGQKITVGNRITIPPGATGKVPWEWGEKMVDKVRWIKRAERGDPMV